MEDLCELTTNLSLKDKKRSSTNNDILYPLKNHKPNERASKIKYHYNY